MTTVHKMWGMSGAAAVLLLTAGCSSPVTSSASDAGGGGGSSCDQSCVDAHVGFAIDALISNLYNQSVAGKPTGNQTATANCPLGGTAAITGSDSVDASHDLTDVNLQYDMTNCEAEENGDTLTFSGTITEQGSFDQSSTRTLNYSSTSLAYTGNVGSIQVKEVGCAVHVNDDSNASTEVTGNMCGRTF